MAEHLNMMGDAYGDEKDAVLHPVMINADALGIGVHFPGYGDASMDDEFGEPVFIEYRQGIPYVIIWGDIQQEDPTHIISLEDAKLDRRPQE